jgi:chemotaxis protein methyltransferase CheR
MQVFNDTDLNNLLEQINRKYSVDLLNYAKASLERRLERFLTLYHFDGLHSLTEKIASDSDFFDHFIKEITVNTTEMFRDACCWHEIRQTVIPVLHELPSLRIWHAGCSSGEEVYSMAILLKEEGLYDRCKIVASDLNRQIMETAKAGTYSVKSLELNTDNYKQAGGKYRLEDYIIKEDRNYRMKPELLENVKFLKHDLSTGKSFSKFDLILCRNVLIYFNKTLQEKVFTLFRESLFKKGILIIGKKESMSYYSDVYRFTELNASEKIYRLK